MPSVDETLQAVPLMPEVAPPGEDKIDLLIALIREQIDSKEKPARLKHGESGQWMVGSAGPLDVQAGFSVQTIIVDNYTPQWLYVPACSSYVPPSTYGWKSETMSTSQNVTVKWEAPPGVAQPAPGVGLYAIVRAFAGEVGSIGSGKTA